MNCLCEGVYYFFYGRDYVVGENIDKKIIEDITRRDKRVTHVKS